MNGQYQIDQVCNFKQAWETDRFVKELRERERDWGRKKGSDLEGTQIVQRNRGRVHVDGLTTCKSVSMKRRHASLISKTFLVEVVVML